MDKYLFPLAYGITILFLLSGCKSRTEKKEDSRNFKISPYSKPGSGYQDSLIVSSRSAVFYYPGSAQLLKIKSIMDSSVYDGSMHEFFYQIRNAKIVLQKSWSKIQIVDAKDCRFLVFRKTNGQNEIIDLDKKNDAYGLFLFDQLKSPQLVDMTNIETALSTYFSQ